ncbi:unnamed protein product [Rotaria sordida]|uniref:RING-type domain-containing protein n=1 Tax=Rotaria sordida TaxID=392033 RepID=A0A814TEA3_9BILA|nr:unnamed protein product [Rotaria sordida]CAF3822877.1 unnamed protein product [Rotaria sordida]
MATAKVQTNGLNDYDYINETAIDSELKCSLCMQPFQVPVSTTCGHTFCQACISQWVVRQSKCPTCGTRASIEEFQSISTRIVLNQLDKLLMRCKRCNQVNIQRGNINEHEKRCLNRTVSCPAFDIKCTWKGTRDALTGHIQECPFQKIRPAIDDIYEQLKNIYEPLINELQIIRQQLEKQMQRNNEQNRFLLAVFNKGKPMSDRCSGQPRHCQLQQSIQMHTKSQIMQHIQAPVSRIFKKSALSQQLQATEFQRLAESPASPEEQSERNSLINSPLCCANCQNGVDPSDIQLHHCEGGCICRSCVEKYGNLDEQEQNLTNTS